MKIPPRIDAAKLADTPRDVREKMAAAAMELRRRRAAENTAKRLRHVEEHADEVRARCKSFAGFVREAWHVIEPETPLKWSWHLDAMCMHLEAISRGEITPWLIINVPPGSSKSTIVAVMWQAWEWGPCGRKGLRYLSTSFEIDNATRDSRKTRDLIESSWFQALWPDVTLTRRGEGSFQNTAQGTRQAVAFVAITGKRGDRVVIDDPHSLDGAESEADRNKAVRRFLEGGLNRVNDQTTSAIVVVMQRLHEGDLTGALLARQFGFIHLCIPMEFEPERRCVTPIWEDPRTYDGELMDPVRMPRVAVERLKGVNEYYWAGQYQQRPTSREGGLFKYAWFEGKIVGAAPAQAKRVRAWDFAGTRKKTGNRPDWTVGLRVAKADGKFFVEHVHRFRDTPGEVRKSVMLTAQLDRAAFGIDVTTTIPKDPGQAGVDQAETYIVDLAGYDVVLKPPTGEKEVRARPAAAQAQAGNIYLVGEEHEPWIKTFLDEVCAFPGGIFDDQVDALSDAINELTIGDTFDLDVFIRANS